MDPVDGVRTPPCSTLVCPAFARIRFNSLLFSHVPFSGFPDWESECGPFSSFYIVAAYSTQVPPPGARLARRRLTRNSFSVLHRPQCAASNIGFCKFDDRILVPNTPSSSHLRATAYISAPRETLKLLSKQSIPSVIAYARGSSTQGPRLWFLLELYRQAPLLEHHRQMIFIS